MKQLIILITCSISFIECSAQAVHIPDPKAQQINDKAVSTYLRYNKNHDSVLSSIHMLNSALAIDSNYFRAWTNKLGFECQVAQYDDALVTAKKIVRIFPSETGVLFFSGLLEFKTGHNDDATATFSKLVTIYDAVPDTNSNPDHLKTALLNKAIALKLLDKADESKDILVTLSMKERDLAVRRHVNSYISKTKEEIIDTMLKSLLIN